MVEAPRIRIIYEKIAKIKGKIIVDASGSSYRKNSYDLEKFIISNVWFCGKYIFMTVTKEKIQLVIRTHMMMFGKIIFFDDNNANTENHKPFMKLIFHDGSLLLWFYSQIMILDPNNHSNEIKSNFGIFSSHETITRCIYMQKFDVSHPLYNEKMMIKRLTKLKNKFNLLILSDFLLDQYLFPGIGNIVQQEALYSCRLNPNNKVSTINESNLHELVKKLHLIVMELFDNYTNGIKTNFIIYHKKYCILGHKTITKYCGVKNRRVTWCPICQPLILL